MNLITEHSQPHSSGLGRSRTKRAWVALLVAGSTGMAAMAQGTTAPLPAGTTLADFFGHGTQPGTLIDPIQSVNDCKSCHGGYDPLHEQFEPWAASMMAQAQRDPLYLASLSVANQDAAFAGDLCLRCHTPTGWLAGRTNPTDGSALVDIDLEGINCNFCHRMVDPDHTVSLDPAADLGILTALEVGDNGIPVSQHSGHYVIDPNDVRRGPFDLGTFARHDWLVSPYHSSSEACAACHDVSNPVYSRQPDGTYAVNDVSVIPPSQNKLDQFPSERTYSEWSMSQYALGPVETFGRFGGNITAVSSCQDCHMPDGTGAGAKNRALRDDLPSHFFNGGNTWVLNAVRNLYPDSLTDLTSQSASDSIARAVTRLQSAADLEAWQDGTDLVVRVTNWSGHKLPTGYPEGRRMWLNIRFLDAGGLPVAEHGAYDNATAVLTTGNTQVWDGRLGVGTAAAAALGVPAGEGFHFALSNEWVKDNRIPPLGFTNAGFEAVQAAPIGAVYADGQHWDDNSFAVPVGAASAEVRLFYQTSSLEYITFLRDENFTDSNGQTLWDQYVATGMSAPVEMGSALLALALPCPADMNGNGILDNGDIGTFVAAFLAGC
ncbi:MAG: hypothetical protein ACI89L_002138 [Phycisphaerales bacterium]|jgi:hypothetical protein